MSCGKPCGCPSYRAHLLSISVAMSPQAKAIDDKERVLRQDLDAYKRLRKDGLQPRRIDGSARLERHADRPVEVESGVLTSDVKGKPWTSI